MVSNFSIKYAIVCRDNDLAWWSRERSVDFLVDGKKITKENCILISENFLNENYQYTGRPLHERKITHVLEQRNPMIHHGLFWLGLRIKYPMLRHAIFAMEVGRSATLRNSFLKCIGIQSWFWSYSVNMSFMWGKKEEYFKNLNYDHYICWNQQQAEAMREAGCTGQFHIVGPIFTENHQRATEPEGIYFYDTSFPNEYTTTEDYILFLKDILKVKRRSPEEKVFLKLKRPLFPGQASQVDVPYAEWNNIKTYTAKWEDPDEQVTELFKRLKDSGVNILNPSYNNDWILFNAKEIIAMPYSSIVLEASALGVPARWWCTERDPRDYTPALKMSGASVFRELLTNEC